jgi:hypothetical protein
MPKLTWDPKKNVESRAAEAAFDVYTKHKFVAMHKGQVVREFDFSHGELTFEPRPNAFNRILEDAPWDN